MPWKGKYLENEIDLDKSLITNFYHNKGFKDFYFIEDLTEFNDNSIDLNYKVYEGQSISIVHLDGKVILYLVILL